MASAPSHPPSMPPYAEAIVYIFLLIACGYGAALTGILKEHTADGLSNFVFTIAVPFLLFRTLTTADMGDLSPWGLWAAYFTAIAVTWITARFVIRRVFGRDARSGVVAGVTGAFSNLALLGLPFMQGVYGHQGLTVLSLLLSIHMPIMMACSLILFQGATRADGVETGRARPLELAADFFRQLFANPLIIGILAGVAVRFSGVPIPHLAFRLVDALATVAGPLALFSMGMGMRRFGIRGHARAASALAGLKLVMMPAVALAAAWTFGLPPLTAKVVVAAASLPAGVNCWVIADQLGTGQRLASTALTIGTASAIVTTAFWLTVAGWIFG